MTSCFVILSSFDVLLCHKVDAQCLVMSVINQTFDTFLCGDKTFPFLSSHMIHGQIPFESVFMNGVLFLKKMFNMQTTSLWTH